jgi:acyl-CoA synthetase (AMP-forming)/AMP-acid ligase II
MVPCVALGTPFRWVSSCPISGKEGVCSQVHGRPKRTPPAATPLTQAVLPCGWLRTGDLGWLDAAGRLWLLGRAKDMVKSGGENVHAREVEAMLEGHPAVAAAAVVGLPHTRLGETVRLCSCFEAEGTAGV